MAEGGNRDCELQKNIIAELHTTQLKKDDIWFLIDTKWFKQWKKYVGFDSWDTGHVGDETSYPGPIDNTPLYKDGSTELLKEHLIDELDYVLLPDNAWQKLVEWYGIVQGQVPIVRKVIEHGMFVKHCKVEVYLMDLKLCPNSDLDNVQTKYFSRADTIDVIEKVMRELFEIKTEKEVRLWNKYMTNTYERLNKPDNTVQDVGLYPGQIIVIEEQNDDGTWPRHTKSTGTISHNTSSSSNKGSLGDSSSQESSHGSASRSNSSYGGSSNYYTSHSYYGDSSSSSMSQPGICGLSNLGNTCFMNSAIQCMSNVQRLTKHMLSESWQDDLNYNNPLGMRGEIASSYAELVKNMWSGRNSSTMPRAFKMAVGRFAPQFSGYQQQDAQELMAFLLDGLHEDLNRIKNKPYVELKDADGRPDSVVAQESWDNYRKRNDSVIVDIFHGQLKSTLVCPECQKISVTFDPFCYLSLPLPYKKERNIKVILVPLDPTKKRRQYKLIVPNHGMVKDLCTALSKISDIPVDKLVVTDVYNHRLHKLFSMEETLNHILDRDDIYMYEMPVSSSDDPQTHVVPVYLREQKSIREKQSCNNYSHTTTHLFGLPLLVPVPRSTCTYETLYNCVLDRMQRYVEIPDQTDEWWAAENDSEDMDLDEGTNDNSDKKSSGSEEEDAVEEQGGCTKERPRLFTFSVINSYGNAEMDKIKDADEPIKFTSRMYLAADWHPKAKAQFYQENKAEELELDESLGLRPKKHVIQLTECMDLFTTTELLGKQDPWFCPQCKEFRQATKKFDLWQVPHMLVIHLKRFQYNRLWRDKLDAVVEYPTRGLDMHKWLINGEHGQAMYDLKGVVNHYGGMGGGHYTAYCQNKDDNQWYHFDDSSVSPCSDDAVVTKAGYVLVYQRRDPSHSKNSSTITNGNANYKNEEMEVN